MAYNLSFIDDNSTIVDMLVSFNNSVGNQFIAHAILFAMWIIVFLSFKDYELKSNVATASGITLIVGIVMYLLQLVSFSSIMVLFIITLGSSLLLFIDTQAN